jgi:hypothetical protein
LAKWPGVDQGIGEDTRAAGDDEGVLSLLGRQDATVGSDPGRVRVAEFEQHAGHKLVGLGQQPRRPETIIAVELSGRQLRRGEQARQPSAES